jgi:hypothetical protein
MKAQIRTDGILFIEPENETEKYALNKWILDNVEKLKGCEIGFKMSPPREFEKIVSDIFEHPMTSGDAVTDTP